MGDRIARGVPWNWPEDIVDAERLFEVLGYHTSNPQIVGLEASGLIVRAEEAVERARISGRVRRLSVKDSKTGEVAAYGYRRADVRRILGMD